MTNKVAELEFESVRLQSLYTSLLNFYNINVYKNYLRVMLKIYVHDPRSYDLVGLIWSP